MMRSGLLSRDNRSNVLSLAEVQVLLRDQNVAKAGKASQINTQNDVPLGYQPFNFATSGSIRAFPSSIHVQSRRLFCSPSHLYSPSLSGGVGGVLASLTFSRGQGSRRCCPAWSRPFSPLGTSQIYTSDPQEQYT